jgi:diguanylate cyclase (GGDEF)-like protein
MQMQMSLAEGAALHGLLEQTTGDIVFRTDHKGFIEAASSNITEIGYDLSQWLFKPHLSDLADREYTVSLTTHADQVLAQSAEESGIADWLEFPMSVPAEGATGATSAMGEGKFRKKWFALSLRAIKDDAGSITGGLGLLRSVERMKTLEGEVYSRALIDPLTGLSNRQVFSSALHRQISSGEGGMVSLFEIDRLRAVFMQHGQQTVDEVLWGFAKFLEAMTMEGSELAQIGGERFCVLLPGVDSKATRHWAEDVLQTFASLALAPSARSPRLSASAGLACVRETVDLTLREAELALVMARARGGMQVAETPAASLAAAAPRSGVAL